MVELVVVIPIVSVIAIGIITLVMSMFFQIMANNSRMNLLLEAQTVLLSLQDELLFTTNYGETTMSNLNDPYKPSGGWDFDTNPDTLIIYETTLTAPRRDPDREFVYRYTSYSCSGANANYNPIAFDNVIYFVEPNANNDYYTLYRRVLTPQYTTCGTNYRVQTCHEENVGVDPCYAIDSTISTNVVDFQVDYYDADNNLIDTSGSGSPLNAEKITLHIRLGDKLFTKRVEAKSSITMRKIN
jgi:hypothetical protein